MSTQWKNLWTVELSAHCHPCHLQSRYKRYLLSDSISTQVIMRYQIILWRVAKCPEANGTTFRCYMSLIAESYVWVSSR